MMETQINTVFYPGNKNPSQILVTNVFKLNPGLRLHFQHNGYNNSRVV